MLSDFGKELFFVSEDQPGKGEDMVTGWRK
jgi:hypothetical protein